VVPGYVTTLPPTITSAEYGVYALQAVAVIATFCVGIVMVLEHYSHIRLHAKKAALDRLDGSTKGTSKTKGTSIKRAK
jgi:hypothetical protein